MSRIENGIEILEDEECWKLLADTTVGRLAVDVAGQPDIFPINYLVDQRTILFRTAAGAKLAAAALMHHVAFEIDGYEPDERTAWSVVIKGHADQIENVGELYRAEDLPLFPWVASIKPNFVRITPTSVSGRRFHVIDEVSPDSSIGWESSSATEPAVAPRADAEFHPGAPLMHPD